MREYRKNSNWVLDLAASFSDPKLLYFGELLLFLNFREKGEKGRTEYFYRRLSLGIGDWGLGGTGKRHNQMNR